MWLTSRQSSPSHAELHIVVLVYNERGSYEYCTSANVPVFFDSDLA